MDCKKAKVDSMRPLNSVTRTDTALLLSQYIGQKKSQVPSSKRGNMAPHPDAKNDMHYREWRNY